MTVTTPFAVADKSSVDAAALLTIRMRTVCISPPYISVMSARSLNASSDESTSILLIDYDLAVLTRTLNLNPTPPSWVNLCRQWTDDDGIEIRPVLVLLCHFFESLFLGKHIARIARSDQYAVPSFRKGELLAEVISLDQFLWKSNAFWSFRYQQVLLPLHTPAVITVIQAVAKLPERRPPPCAVAVTSLATKFFPGDGQPTVAFSRSFLSFLTFMIAPTRKTHRIYT